MSHAVVLRGAGAELLGHYLAATHDGVEPPLEWVAEGPAGTGKSMGWLAATLALASMYPRVPGRVLVTRFTRRSLTTSTCVTLRKLLYPGHPMLDGARDDHRTGYQLGAWEFVLAGLDNVDNLLSTEWDIIGGEECRQFPLKAWEEFSRGVRNYALYRYNAAGELVEPGRGVSAIPWGMVVGATNPWTPKHWIMQRARRGKLQLRHTVIEENPGYYGEDGTELPMGTVYKRRREQMTGVRYRRLVLGEWCSAEGMVFEEWSDSDPGSEDSNLFRAARGADWWISRETLKALDIREFYAGVDYGDDAAGCMVVAGLTGAGKLLVIAEVYARKKDLDWWEGKVSEIHRHYPITLAFCDHNRDDWSRAFNDVVGAPRDGPGAIFVKADKGVSRGLQVMRTRIARRTLLFDVDALMHPPDPTLVEASLPTCTVDEIPEYIYARDSDDDDEVSSVKPADRPDKKCHDHGCDATRYLCVGVDYIEPEKKLADPPNIAYRNRLRYLQKVRTGVLPAGDELEDEVDEEDWLVDNIRKTMNVD